MNSRHTGDAVAISPTVRLIAVLFAVILTALTMAALNPQANAATTVLESTIHTIA